jgi:signal peptidase I
MVTTFKNKTVALIKTIDENSYSHEYKTLKGERFPVMNLGQLILNKDNNKISLNKNSSWSITCDTDVLVPHHLYILSDEEIKDGDKIVFKNNYLYTVSENRGHYLTVKELPHIEIRTDLCKKIIATTDKSLGYTDHIVSPVPNFCSYPQLSQSFIDEFVKHYNNGNKITDVLVEYHERNDFKELNGEAYTLLTNNEDNSINIKIIKESWNKEEVIEHMWLAYKKSNTVFSDQKVLRKEFDEWIKNII